MDGYTLGFRTAVGEVGRTAQSGFRSRCEWGLLELDGSFLVFTIALLSNFIFKEAF